MRNLIRKWVDRKTPGLIGWAQRTRPDQIIGVNYLDRWWLVKNINNLPSYISAEELRPDTRKTKFWQVFLHRFTGSDEVRALHDHPWVCASIVLRGSYVEVMQDRRILRSPGDIVIRLRPSKPHRIEIVDDEVWTLFFTLNKVREWGFWCHNGWVHWKQFVDRGCE